MRSTSAIDPADETAGPGEAGPAPAADLLAPGPSGRVAAIHAAALSLSSAPTHAAIAEALLSACLGALGGAAGLIALEQPGDGGIAVAAAAGLPPPTLAALELRAAGAPPPLADLLLQDEPLWAGAGHELAARHPRLQAALGQGDLEGWAVAPLRCDGRARGALAVAFAAPRPLAPEDHTFLATLVILAETALARLRQGEAERRHAAADQVAADRATAHTLRLQTLTAALAEALTPGEVLAIVAAQVGQLVGVCSGAIGLVSADGRELELVQMVGYAPDDLRPWQRMSLGSAQPGPDVVRSGEAQFWETRAAFLAHYPQIDEASLRSGAWAIVPLRGEGRTLGVLSLGFPEARSFSPEERALLELLAQQCATAVQRTARYHAVAQARAAAEQAADRTARLYAVTAALAEALTLAEVAEVIVTQGMAALGAVAGSVRELSSDGEALIALRVVGYPPELVEQWRVIPLDAAVPMAAAARLARPILIESPAEVDASWPQFVEAMAALRYQAVAILPLMVGGGPIGTMSLGFAGPRPFTADDRGFLEALARQCAVALERARLYAATEAQAARLGALAEASQLFAAASLDMNGVLDTIAWRVVHSIGDLGVVSLLSDDRRALQLAAVAHADDEAREAIARLLRSFPVGPDEGLSGRAISTGQAQLLAEISPDQLRALLRPEHRPYLDRFGLHSLMVAPLRANGEVIGTLAAMRDRPGRPFGANDLAMLQELADRAALAVANARLYQQAREAIQIRDQFLSIAAHELKTPLTALSGQVQLVQRRLDRGEQSPERLARSVAIMARQADRLDAMVAALLDVGRIERGQFVLERQVIDLVALIDRVVDEVQPDLDRHTLLYAAGPRPILVDCDALRIEQVVQNLVSNAVKYSPAGGTITLRVGRRGDTAVITVADQGVGIPAAALPQLFQRFYRAANVTEHHISGMGIGLYVVREIVTRHGGSVEVTSVEGHGSLFTVTLPAAADEAAGGL